MLQRALTLGLGVALGTTSNACFKDCDSYYDEPSYLVTVTDGASGARICDADVTMDGITQARRSETACNYALPIPGTTTVTLSAEKSGYLPASQQVSTKFDNDECGHAQPIQVKLVLTPE